MRTLDVARIETILNVAAKALDLGYCVSSRAAQNLAERVEIAPMIGVAIPGHRPDKEERVRELQTVSFLSGRRVVPRGSG